MSGARGGDCNRGRCKLLPGIGRYDSGPGGAESFPGFDCALKMSDGGWKIGRMESAGTRERMGEYHVVRELSAGKCWLAEDAAGRRVVLKMLPEDCLAKGQLRASIRDRLARFREAAHGGLGNLLGVERDG